MGYEWRSRWTRLAKVLRSSLAKKRNAGWSRENGPGFLAEEINDVEILSGRRLGVHLKWLHYHVARIQDFNLRETEELLKFAERRLRNS